VGVCGPRDCEAEVEVGVYLEQNTPGWIVRAGGIKDAMNTRSICVSVGLFSLSLFFSNSAHSELVQTVNFRLVARVTGMDSETADTHTRSMQTVRISTKDILVMLGNATSNDFHGATLVCVHRGVSYEVRRGTNVLADVSEFFVDEGASQDVVDQDLSYTTGKDNYHGYWLRTFTCDDQNGDRLSLNSMTEERYTAKAADSEGMQVISDIETLNGTGSGTLQTSASADQGAQFTVVSGTITLSGKGVVPKDTF